MTCIASISAILCFLTVIFLLVGCSGNSESETTLKEVPWGVCDYSGVGSGDFWLGTSFYVGSGYFGDGVEKYSDCEFGWCDTCENVGAAAVGLSAAAIVLAVITVLINVYQLIGSNTAVLTSFSIVSSFLCSLFSAIGFVLFHDCLVDLVDGVADTVGSATANYGTGAYLVLSAVVTSLAALVVNMSHFCCCSHRQHSRLVVRDDDSPMHPVGL